jgi:hypothetical protein
MKKVVVALVCMLLMLSTVLFQFEAVAVTQTKPPLSRITTPPIVTIRPPVTNPPVTVPPFIKPGISKEPPHRITKPPVPEKSIPVRETPVPETPTPKPQTPKPHTPKPPASTEVPAAGQNICSMGLYFREMRPKLTDEWYFFTPIELNFDGVQVYPLIASNSYEVGKLKLTIENGQLLAEYQVLEGINILDEFLTFFPTLDSVKTVNVQMLEGQNFPFNQPIDIAKAFGEDTKVILYMNNAVSFNNTIPGLKHFVLENYRPWMWEIMDLLD